MNSSPHPREAFDLEGQKAAETAFLNALNSGRLHHAWLLRGPEGVGKASFAYRAARRLLGAKADSTYGLLGSAPDDPVSRQILARSHPDLLVLQRLDEDGGKARRNIPVEEARRLPEFFSTSPASAPYRVAIIDAADDLNVNAANAVLKTLEEPPAKGVLLLISHAPGRLLPTIRSRCRTLNFAPWSEAKLAEWLEERGVGEAQSLAGIAHGSPGRALMLAAGGGDGLDQAAAEVLRGADPAALLHLADSFKGGEGAQRFALLFERLASRVAERAAAASLMGENGEAWARAYELLMRLPAEAEALNLDRADTLFTAARELRLAANA